MVTEMRAGAPATSDASAGTGGSADQPRSAAVAEIEATALTVVGGSCSR